MDKETRNDIREATEAARKLLTDDFAEQLLADFNVHSDGRIDAKPRSPELTGQHAKIIAAVQHKRAAGFSAADAVADYLRDAAFTTLNRFVALKMLEARELVQQCVSKGEESSGYGEFCGLMPGLRLLPNRAGYRLYIESLFDELSTEVKVLFDRRDPAAVLWPRRPAFDQLLILLNDTKLAGVWGEDETIGWVYQFFNSKEERAAMRDTKKSGSHAPRNSRELAVRNQFFTPRYVVQFLTDNTLGRVWYEMRDKQTRLGERCDYLVHKPGEVFAARAKKDPRDIRVLDPACGSGHFLLYAFDLLLSIYEEAHADPECPASEASGKTLAADYPDIVELRRAIPKLILAHNLYGVDIDPRCAQIATLALWMRAQRALRDFGISRDHRPRVRKSNIVVAEPLTADEVTLRQFLVGLGDIELERIFSSLIDTLRLAGDLGLLLRLETLVTPPLERNATGPLFAPAEARIRAALHDFVERSHSITPQRRLFVDDAAQGIGLLEAAERRYDVILMNPPFGEPTRASQRHLLDSLPDGANDIYAAFVVRFRQMLNAGGRLGAITSRSFFVGRDLRRFREHLIEASGPGLEFVLDYGPGVLDATVETAAYVLGSKSLDAVRFLDLRRLPKTSTEMLSAISRREWSQVTYARLKTFPACQFLYAVSVSEADALINDVRIEPGIARVTKGLSTGDDERFVRLRWEVQGQTASTEGAGWELFSKGGEYGWFGSDVHLLIRRHHGGAELATHAEQTHGNVALSRQSSTYYSRAGVTWSRRSQKGFSARRLRFGVCFSDKSPVIVPANDPEHWIPALIGILTSDTYLNLIYAQSKFGSYETGSVKALPYPALGESSSLISSICRIFEIIDAMDQRDETCQLFRSPPPQNWNLMPDMVAAMNALADSLSSVGHNLNNIVRSKTLEEVAARNTRLTGVLPWISYATGVVLGRVFTAPLLLTTDQGVPAFLAPVGPPHLGSTAGCGRLADDEGSEWDIVPRISEVLNREAPYLNVNESDLRLAVRNELFGWHLDQYTKSARKAPIYWQLATSSASYSIWLYIHAFNRDTLFRVQEDYAATKLRHEERKLESLRQEHGTNAGPAERRAIADQEAFVDELRSFLEEVRRVTPLWNPNLDDGVLLNFAPLWRLVPQNRAWQKELKSAWDGLCNAEYEWAHLAMHLWPERVVPNCATDRSLAIAHGLEGVFWVQGADGKWTARATPTRSVAELVQERSSPAVKAALNNLLEAPAATGATRKPRRDKANA